MPIYTMYNNCRVLFIVFQMESGTIAWPRCHPSMYIHRYVLLFWCTSMFKCFALYSLNQVIGDLPLSSRWFGGALAGPRKPYTPGKWSLGRMVQEGNLTSQMNI